MSTQGRLSIEEKSTPAFDAVERGPIYHLSVYCDRLFKQILEERHIKLILEDHKRLLLSELQVRFTNWLSQLGVFASAEASLDHRLKRNAAYHDLVLLSLDKLMMNLMNLLPAHNTSDRSSEPDICHDPDFLNVAISGLQDATSQLDRLATTIHQFSSSILAARVKSFADKFFKDLVHFETRAILALEAVFPDAPARLRIHLAKSMTDRFARLLYLKSHNGKLRADRLPGDTIKPEISRSLETMDKELSKTDIRAEANSTKNSSLDEPILKRPRSFEQTKTNTVATIIASKDPIEATDPHAPRPERRATSVAVSKHVYPSPPKFEPGLTHAACTFCYKKYSVDEYSQNSWWKNHVKEDLQPYVCLVPDCHDSKIFSIDEAWKSHMAEEHGKYWFQLICKISSHGSDKVESTRDFPPAFLNKDAPRSHLSESHEHNLPQDIDAETSYTKLKAICGFCSKEIEKEENLAPKGKMWHVPEAPVSKDGRYSAVTNSGFDESLAKTLASMTNDGTEKAAVSGDNKSSTALFSREISRHISSHLEYLSLLTLWLSSSMRGEGKYGDFYNCFSDSELEGQAERGTLADTITEAKLTAAITKAELADTITKAKLTNTITEAEPADTITEAKPNNTSNRGKSYESVSNNHVEGSWTHLAGREIRSKLLPDNEPMPNQFLPIGDLETILPRTSIAKILQEILIGDHSILNITEKILGSICKPSLKVFATLILIEKVGHITQLLQLEVHDGMLPLTLRSGPEVFQNWSQSDIEAFCERQYTFMAPIFDFTTTQHCHWSRLLRMPFLEPLKWEKGGAHGQVAKVKIHLQHQVWKTPLNSSTETSCFAVKRFTAKDAQGVANFNKERAALLRFSGENSGHKHLIKLLLSYQIEESLYMIFPWADGNLAEFWKRYRSNPSGEDSFWFIKQCFGLSDGLSKVHGYNQRLPRYGYEEGMTDMDAANRGRHGDIKPENILFFLEPESDRGHLVVSDFTLMRFHSEDTINKTVANMVGFSTAYCPPEVQHGSDIFVHQKYDIWTLGCVYLEFATWYLLGYDAIRGRSYKTSSGDRVQSFLTMRRNDHGGSDDRYFSHVPGLPPKVKTSVSTWIRMLRKHEHCSQAIHDFLSLIDHHMLVPLPNNRYSMDEVRDELQIIASKCQEDRKYCQAGSPMGTIRRGLNHLHSRLNSFQSIREQAPNAKQSRRGVLGEHADLNIV